MERVLRKTTFIDQIEALPPLTAVVKQVLAVTASPTSSASDVARVLCEDQTLAAKILRVANSPFYGASHEVTQVSRAVVMLGSVAVRNLVLGICARDSLSSRASQEPEHELLWRHSIAVASACDLIARQIGFRPPEEAFLGGLLHDIGQLAMVTFQPEAFRAVFRDQATGVCFLALERLHLGMDHTEAGSRILTRWGLPEPLCQVVKKHHDPQICEQDGCARLLSIVILGDIFAHLIGIGFDVPARTTRRATASTQFLGLSDSDQLRVLYGLENRINQASAMFASSDAAGAEDERPSSKRAVWVTRDDTHRYNVGQLLLEHCGYEVQGTSAEGLAGIVSPDDLIMIDLPQEDEAVARELAQSLITKGHRQVVILSNHLKGSPLREHDPETGAWRIPGLFTAFDVKWVEEQLEP